MSYQLIDIADVVEPLTLSEAKSYCLIDQDYPQHDAILSTHITSARIYLEQNLNVGLVRRDVRVQWDGKLLDMPLSPTGEVNSVKEDGVVIGPEKYTVSKYNAASIFVNSMHSSNAKFFYTNDGAVEVWESSDVQSCKMYEVDYSTGHVNTPKPLKDALAMHVVYLFQLMGAPDSDPSSSGALKKVSMYSCNLIL